MKSAEDYQRQADEAEAKLKQLGYSLGAFDVLADLLEKRGVEWWVQMLTDVFEPEEIDKMAEVIQWYQRYHRALEFREMVERGATQDEIAQAAQSMAEEGERYVRLYNDMMKRAKEPHH